MSSLPSWADSDSDSPFNTFQSTKDELSGIPEFEVAWVDGDIFRYEIGSLTDKHPFLNDGTRVPVSPQFIYDRMDERINRIKQVTRCKRMVIFLTGSGNFRFDIAKQQSYKGNRSGVEKPFHYETVGTYLIERYGAVVVEGREADDALAIGLRTTKSSILCSRDKDLWTVEGWHYRWACGDHQPEVLPHYVTKEKADAKFFTQMLIGDDTDNILGCALRKDVLRGGVEIKSRYIPIPFAKRRKLLRFKIGKKLCKNWRVGVGAVEAKRLVDATDGSVEQLYQMVEQQYQKHCGPHWEDVMLENARLLYMGQSKDKLFEWTWIL